MPRPAVRAAILHMLPGYLAEAGVGAESVLATGGLAVEQTASPAIVLRAQVVAVLAAAARTLGEPSIGLALGAAADPARLGGTGQAMMAGPTVADCLLEHVRLMPAMQTHVDLGLSREGDLAVLSHRLAGDAPEEAWVLYEGAAAFHLQTMRALIGPDWTPAWVSFPHACRGRLASYEAFFGAPVIFGRGTHCRMGFAADVLATRPRTDGLLGRPPSEEPAVAGMDLSDVALRDALALLVEARWGEGPVSLAVAADVVGLPRRTLQRRLARLGTSFEAIVDERRRASAIQWIAEGSRSVTEVAMALGYADTPHFIRAFRRWTGQPPLAYRRSRSFPTT
ncbi:AraC family transcriptional regulator ligand-binding domain-containing protein [Alsobacter sp. R-9]